jgi:hypothetical protein
MRSCRATIKLNEGEPDHAASPLQQARAALCWAKVQSGLERSDRNGSREARVAPSGPHQEHDSLT